MTGSTSHHDGQLEIARGTSSTPTPEERAALREDLTRPLPEIDPRYFYDDRGSELFEQITGLEVYYQTRTEIAILERFAPAIMKAVNPDQLIELGSGAGRKIRLLLDAWRPSAKGGTCSMLDINELFLRQSLRCLRADYPALRFRGIVGDFVQDLGRLGPAGRRLVVFFAGTMGNLYPEERHAFLCELADGMDETDAFLVGVDLVKDRTRLEAAYDDPKGVTAAFNRNMLAVLNRRFNADFDPTSFAHRAFYDAENAWIEMRLRATQPARVHVRALDLRLDLEKGAEIRTEISCKFTRTSLAASAAAAGLVLEAWYPDQDELFALALLRKAAS